MGKIKKMAHADSEQSNTIQKKSKKVGREDPHKPSLDEVAKKIKALEAGAPPKPILRRYKTNDATVEKLGEILRDNPYGICVVRDELVGLLAAWEKAGHEGDRTFFLESWNGIGSFDTDRIGRGSIFVPNLCLSIFGGIQPDKLRALLELMADALANDGTLQRFQLMVYPDFQEWEWCDRIPDKVARDKVYVLFERLCTFDPIGYGAFSVDEFNKIPYFHFSPEAQQIFIQWSDELHRSKIPNEDNQLIVQHLTKYDKLFPALALILHIVDCVFTGASGSVSAQAALRAVAWCQYLETHARRCYGLIADAGLCSAQHLVDKIKKGKLLSGFTARDVQRHQWSRLTTPESIQAAISWLQDAHWLHCTTAPVGKQGGRPTEVYHINPKIPREDGNHAEELA